MDLKTGKTVAEPYALETYGDLKVAFVGISTPESFTKSTPTYFQDENGNYIYSFCEGNDGQDLYDAVQASIDAAAAEGADVTSPGSCGVDEQSSPCDPRRSCQHHRSGRLHRRPLPHRHRRGSPVQDQAGNDVVLTSTGTKLANIGEMTIAPTAPSPPSWSPATPRWTPRPMPLSRTFRLSMRTS